ncbi:MAG: EI24 domain-containing protein [Bacteroidota bacterium]
MLEQFNLTQFIPQSLRCLKVIRESYSFFVKHKLWRGIFEHKWILLITLVVSSLFTYTIFSNIIDFLFNTQASFSTSEGATGKAINKASALLGGSKFLFLILLEIVIFHFSVKTLEVLNNEKYETTFGMFVNAEVRMIKVMIRSAIQSIIVQAILWVVLGILGYDALIPFLMFIVHAYFIGLAFFDNYNEQQKLNVKESDICIRHQSGAATTLGLVASVGLLIPFIGPLVVPVFGAIAANIYGHRHHIENPPHHVSEQNSQVDLQEEMV